MEFSFKVDITQQVLRDLSGDYPIFIVKIASYSRHSGHPRAKSNGFTSGFSALGCPRRELVQRLLCYFRQIISYLHLQEKTKHYQEKC
jgi:hypothetical protein